MDLSSSMPVNWLSGKKKKSPNLLHVLFHCGVNTPNMSAFKLQHAVAERKVEKYSHELACDSANTPLDLRQGCGWGSGT